MSNNHQMSKLWFCGATRAVTQAAASGTPLPWGPEILNRRRCTGHTASDDMVWQGLCKRKRGGVQGGAQPPLNCQLISIPLFIAGCKDQNGSEMVAQEQFRRIAAPLNCLLHMTHSLTGRYGMTVTVQTQERGVAGGAQPPLNCLTYLNAALHCRLQRSEWLRNGCTGAVGCREYSPFWIALTTLGTNSMQVAAQALPNFLWSAGSHPTCYTPNNSRPEFCCQDACFIWEGHLNRKILH